MYLENKLKSSGKVPSNVKLTIDMVKEMLKKRFLSVDYKLIKKDVYNFIADKDSLNIWSSNLFISTIDNLEFK